MCELICPKKGKSSIKSRNILQSSAKPFYSRDGDNKCERLPLTSLRAILRRIISWHEDCNLAVKSSKLKEETAQRSNHRNLPTNGSSTLSRTIHWCEMVLFQSRKHFSSQNNAKMSYRQPHSTPNPLLLHNSKFYYNIWIFLIFMVSDITSHVSLMFQGSP